jgi:hypothetical protein
VPAIRRVLCLSVALAALAACGSDPAPGGSTGPSSEECAKQRDRLVEAVRQPLQRATDQVMGSVRVSHRNALRPTGRVLRRVEADECVVETAASSTLVRLARTYDVRRRHLRRAHEAFDQWAGWMGSPDAGINLPPDPCMTLREEVRASYRVNREPEQGGIQVSLEIVLENNSSSRVDLFHGGRVRATHVMPDDRTGLYGWGGSSADTATAAPGHTSTQPVDLLPEQRYLPPLAGPHLFPSGHVDVYGLYGYSGPCNLGLSRIP